MENKNTNFDILEMLEIENNSSDILSTISIENTIENEWMLSIIPTPLDETPIVTEWENSDILVQMEEKQEKTWNKFLSSFIFLIKYLATSSAIFMLLLSASNYSAYVEIARSYLNPELLEQNKNALLSSVYGSKIITETNTWTQQKETTNEKVSTVQNKTYHSMDKLLNGSYDSQLNMQINIVPYENRVVIPKIGKNIPLLDVKNKTVQNVKELEDVFMKELEGGIVRYPGSAKPGEEWNSFIFGHSSNFPWIKWDYNDVFALLDNVVFWDEVIVYYDQKKYVYKIKEKTIIKPGDVSILKRNKGKSEISLMTCWPVGTTINRMIVIWELIE